MLQVMLDLRVHVVVIQFRCDDDVDSLTDSHKDQVVRLCGPAILSLWASVAVQYQRVVFICHEAVELATNSVFVAEIAIKSILMDFLVGHLESHTRGSNRFSVPQKDIRRRISQEKQSISRLKES